MIYTDGQICLKIYRAVMVEIVGLALKVIDSFERRDVNKAVFRAQTNLLDIA